MFVREKLFKWFAFINSVVGFYPFIGLMLHFLTEKNLSHAQFRLTAGNGSILTSDWVLLLVFMLLTSLIGTLLAFILYKKEKRYIYLTLPFCGGFFAYPFWLVTYFFKNKNQNSSSIKKPVFKSLKTKLVIPTAIIGALSIPVVPLVIIGGEFVYDKPLFNHSHDAPEFSVDPSKPNLLEIFSDGLDYPIFSNIINDHLDKYKDYVFYPKFVTKGFYTGSSFPTLFRGDDYLKNEINGEHITQRGVYGYKFNLVHNLYQQKNFYSTMGPHEWTTYPKSWTSEPSLVEKYIPANVNYVNYEMANTILDRPIDAYNPQIAPYQAFINTAKIGKESYSIFKDHITHIPVGVTEGGGTSFIASSVTESFEALDNVLLQMMTKLKSLVGTNGLSAWDNTSIVIYGDHSSHTRRAIVPGEKYHKQLIQKNNSLLMVKPLKKFGHESVNQLNVSKREIWAPFTQRIVNYIDTGNDPIEYIDVNNNFDEGRIFDTDFEDEEHNHFISNFVDGKLVEATQERLSTLGVINSENGTISSEDYKEYILKETSWKE